MSNHSPTDLFPRFIISRNHLNQNYLHEETETEEIELSLGLSLNGRFGVDPRAKKLGRSSSIADFTNPTAENGNAFVVPAMVSTNDLMRTCSLPTETEEWRKRKEMQTFWRMEAKRKRSEKQGNFKAAMDRPPAEDGSGIHQNHDHNQEQLVKKFNCGLFGNTAEGLSPPSLVAPPSSQSSIGSQGSGLSGLPESESQHQGTNKLMEMRSPASVQSLADCEQRSTITEKSVSLTSENGAKEIVSNVLKDMPCVSTKGDGPNGKRIQGFLCGYREGEGVRIVCVCHGSFFSPAEFVKHGGGGDVANPLKHIVVNASPLW